MKDTFYNEIKYKLIENETYSRIKDYSKEKHRVEVYYEIGKLLSEAGKHYGEGIIKQYSIKLSNELGKKYNVSSLKYMRQFYVFLKSQPLADFSLSWSHYIELLPLKDINKINYYINLCIKNNLSRNELRKRIKLKEYERLDEDTKLKIINKEETNIKDIVPNPIIINNSLNKEIFNEKALQLLILENIKDFLLELGDGYSYISNEYKIKIDNSYNYIDLLLFNIKYNCYVVVELKTTKIKKEHIGQIEVYMDYIDKNLRTIYQCNTIGIIISKENDRFIINYIKDKNIISREYLIKVNN